MTTEANAQPRSLVVYFQISDEWKDGAYTYRIRAEYQNYDSGERALKSAYRLHAKGRGVVFRMINQTTKDFLEDSAPLAEDEIISEGTYCE